MVETIPYSAREFLKGNLHAYEAFKIRVAIYNARTLERIWSEIQLKNYIPVTIDDPRGVIQLTTILKDINDWGFHLDLTRTRPYYIIPQYNHPPKALS